ncbi:MAG: hypothetical protein A2V70_03245 [Planctomycetes bacterium RBG_13_63_9]|nr:MAG: hypothetical protein A2V70_03245 [Planctomycetes bacterium RBG_13_63_9]
MIAKMAICAALLLAPVPQTGQKATAPKDPKKVETPNDTEKSKDVGKSKDVEESKRPDLLSIEVNIISYTNAERAKHGLPALQIDRGLMKSARGHAAWMARGRRLVHTNQPLAENIAMGQPHSSHAVRDWMSSAGHRANILSRAHQRIGVAAYRTPGGTIYWCQQFRQ